MSSQNARPRSILAPIPTGAVIGGKYRLDRLIAEGGMGLVYQGYHLVLDQPVAVKIVRPELAHRSDAVARFLNEARSIAQLRGEHVARVFDSGCIKNGPPYMVLEYLEGSDLRTLLDSSGPLPIPYAIDLVLQATEALAEAHVLGIVHRDIKPENLFLARLPDGTDCLKVLDFGISKRLDGDHSRSFTMQGQSLGSPHYMAPEQMSAPAEVDARADIWSLGVVAFELLAGEVPFDGGSVPTICAQVLSRMPRSLSLLRPEAPPALEAVIVRCLCKRPSQRYASVKELAEALAPFATAAGLRSVNRIRRLFGEAAADDEAPRPELAPRSAFTGSDSVTTVEFGVPRRPLWPVVTSFAAAAAFAVGLRYSTALEHTAQTVADRLAIGLALEPIEPDAIRIGAALPAVEPAEARAAPELAAPEAESVPPPPAQAAPREVVTAAVAKRTFQAPPKRWARPRAPEPEPEPPAPPVTVSSPLRGLAELRPGGVRLEPEFAPAFDASPPRRNEAEPESGVAAESVERLE